MSIKYLDDNGTKHLIDVMSTEIMKKVEMEDATEFDQDLTPEFGTSSGGGGGVSSTELQEIKTSIQTLQTTINQLLSSISEEPDDSDVDSVVDDILGGDGT